MFPILSFVLFPYHRRRITCCVMSCIVLSFWSLCLPERGPSLSSSLLPPLHLPRTHSLNSPASFRLPHNSSVLLPYLLSSPSSHSLGTAHTAQARHRYHIVSYDRTHTHPMYRSRKHPLGKNMSCLPLWDLCSILPPVLQRRIAHRHNDATIPGFHRPSLPPLGLDLSIPVPV